jgi:outer membrane protein
MDYQSQSATMSDLIKQTKEKELQDLQGRIDAFQQKAQTDLQAKQAELVQPFIDKAKVAVKEVAKENKYTYILNSIEDVVLYSETSDDIMPLVKKKLGIAN